MRRLSVDIGSNTAKCLLADLAGEKCVRVWEDTVDCRILGDGGALVPNAAELVSGAVCRFVSHAESLAGEMEVLVTATSAMRNAPEAAEVAERVRRSSGYAVRVLSEYEEAKYSYLGAMGDELIPPAAGYAFFDLGGGSLEVAFGGRFEMSSAFSFPVGAVAMTRRFFCGADGGCAMENLADFLRGVFDSSKLPRIPPSGILVGTGGAVAAARLMKAKCGFAGAENELSADMIGEMARILDALPARERASAYSIPPSRADIIVAAFVVLEVLMRSLGAEHFLQTFRNLRYGLVCADCLWGGSD